MYCKLVNINTRQLINRIGANAQYLQVKPGLHNFNFSSAVPTFQYPFYSTHRRIQTTVFVGVIYIFRISNILALLDFRFLQFITKVIFISNNTLTPFKFILNNTLHNIKQVSASYGYKIITNSHYKCLECSFYFYLMYTLK